MCETALAMAAGGGSSGEKAVRFSREVSPDRRRYKLGHQPRKRQEWWRFDRDQSCDPAWPDNVSQRRRRSGRERDRERQEGREKGERRKVLVVARSSAKAEYRAMTSIACELIWLKALLRDLGIEHAALILLHCNNQAVMHIAANPIFHERTKHIEVDCHFIRNQVRSKLIETVNTRSCDQLADVFTKVLASAQFESLLSKLGSINSLDPA
ncbi:hypothetical protein ACLB2K_072205 [Fragaria x ananassa]